MAIAHPAANRLVPALALSAFALSLLTTGAEALQCPKGYVGGHGPKGPKCVQQATPKPKESKQAKSKPQPSYHCPKGEVCGSTTSRQTISDSDNIPDKKKKKTVEVPDMKKVKPVDPVQTKAVINSNQDNIPSKSEMAKKQAAEDAKKADAAAKQKAADDMAAQDRMAISPTDNTPEKPDPKKKKPALANSSDTNIPDPKSNVAEPKDNGAEARDKGSKVSRRGETDGGDDKPAAAQERSVGDDGGSAKRKASRPTATASIGGAGGGGIEGGGWVHNNSRMSVVSSGNAVTIAYDRPRDGLADLGIKPGTTLFTGTRAGNTVSGEATTFSRRCGTRNFAVSGKQSSDGKRYELTGAKPLLDGNCSVTGTSNEVLVFAAGD